MQILPPEPKKNVDSWLMAVSFVISLFTFASVFLRVIGAIYTQWWILLLPAGLIFGTLFFIVFVFMIYAALRIFAFIVQSGKEYEKKLEDT